MSDLSVETELPLRDESRRALGEALLRYQATQHGDPEFTTLGIFLRDEDGELRGGLSGRFRWGWLYVELLWIAESLRGEGRGTELLSAAEQFVKDRDGEALHLEVNHPDALRFYLDQGFEVAGSMKGFPPGSVQHFLHKKL